MSEKSTVATSFKYSLDAAVMITQYSSLRSTFRINFIMFTLLCALIGGCNWHLLNDSRTPGDLVEHLTDAGFAGTFEFKFVGLIGAEDGGGFRGDNFSVEFYLFNDVSKAKSLEKTGLSGMRCYRNGNFVLFAHEAPEGLITAFTDW